MRSSLAFLLGTCVCGEPVFRHRIGGRQISCLEVRRLDEALQTNNQSTLQGRGPLHVIPRASEFDRQDGVR